MKRIICSILLLSCLFAVFALSAGAEIYEGKALDAEYILNDESYDGLFGDTEGIEEAYELSKFYQVQYKLDTETGVMTIFPGKDETGAQKIQKMLPYARSAWIPWQRTIQPTVMRPYIRTVYIEEGVLSVGRYSFYQCENLREVYLPSTILKIDKTVFYEVPSLETVYYKGNKTDFESNVVLDTVRNEEMLNKIHYGESVKVVNKNQHGEIFESYTVGGYFVGDDYTVEAKSYSAMRPVETERTSVSGKYVANDTTEIVFNYVCEHAYEVKEGDPACKSQCKYCAHMNPDFYDQHDFEVIDDEGGGLFKKTKISRACKDCGYAENFEEPAYIVYIALVASGIVVVVGIFLAIYLPIRRRKKIKDMTW